MRAFLRALVCAIVALCSWADAAVTAPQGIAELARDAARKRAAQQGQSTALREPEWIVGDVIAAIEQMRVRASGGRGPAPAVHATTAGYTPHARFDVDIAGRSRTSVEIADHIWAPGAFAGLARLEAAPRCAPLSPSPLAAALLNPAPDVFLRESARVSARLEANMGCADAHQEAALLVGAFALREAAGAFSDPRRLLSRLTAHLAMADANGGAADTDTRRLADLVLLTLIGRQQDALDRIAQWEAAGAGASLRAWLRALRLRNTFDWRLLPSPGQASALERMALIRAYMTTTGGMQALDALDGEAGIASTPDWARLLLHDNHPGIEAGHRFSEFWIEAELLQAVAAFHRLRGGPPPPDDGPLPDAILAALNEEPGSGPVMANGSIEILDWGTWAAAAQRHVLQAVIVRDTFLLGLGLPKQEIKEARAETARRFGKLGLFPFVAMYDAETAEEFTPAAVACANLVRSRPDVVAYWNWTSLLKKVPANLLKPPVPDTADWFAPYILPGTAFEPEWRPFSPNRKPRLNAAAIDLLHKRAPYSRQLAYLAAEIRGATLAAKQEMFGALAEYDLGMTRELAKAAWADEKTYIKYMSRAAQWDLDAYWDLAPYLADHGRVQEAIDAYQHWFDLARNRVVISNSMRWLVWQYFRRGDQARATKVAEEVAETYSATGLLTLADLHEWRGERDKAEALHRAMAERYESPANLLGFLIRSGRTGAEVDRLTATVFPTGMTRVATASFNGAPSDGVLVETVGVIGEREGLRPCDVVVAVDGVRVRDIKQYTAVRGASGDPLMRFIVYRGGKYLEVPARLRIGWVVSQVDDYKPVDLGGSRIPVSRGCNI